MGQFLYFVPGDSPPSEEQLEALGLDDRLPAQDVTSMRAMPGLKDGRICGKDEAEDEDQGHVLTLNDDVGIYPERQSWAPWPPDEPDYHVGFYDDDPPTEEDLRRESMFGPHAVPLGDGELWAVPTVRRPDGGTELPRTLKVGPDGEERQGDVLPAYADLFDRLEGYAESIYDSVRRAVDGEEVSPEEALEDVPLSICVELLRINYRVGIPEVNELGLLTTESRYHIMQCAVDVPAFMQMVGAEEAEGVKKGVESDR